MSGVPTAPATGDPCSAHAEPHAVLNKVCYERQTITEADGVVTNVAAGHHAGVTFVTFDVGTASFAVVSRDGETWTDHLPADDTLGLRVPVVGEPDLDARAADPYRIVHLATPMLPEWHDALTDAGATVHAYLPVNNFIVRLPADAPDATVNDLAFVEGSGLMPAIAKVEPALLQEDRLRRVNVLTMPGAEGAYAATKAFAQELGATVDQDAPEIERLQLWIEAHAIPTLARFPHVLWIDQAGEDGPETDMSKIRIMTGADHVLQTPAGYDGSTVVGQVMDSGLDWDHPDFQASLLGLDGPVSVSSHGTNVYGIVFGDGTGRPSATGMIPGGHGTFAQYFQGTRYQRAQNVAEDHGGVFQTHSWGNSVPKDNTYDSFSNENDRVVMDLDVLMLQSMSNCGPQCARREAMAKNIISVGALYHFDTTDLFDDEWNGGFSRASTGPAADGRIKPELVGAYDAIETTAVNGYTTGFGGTSGATPIVAGSVGLTHDMWNQGVFGTTGKMSPAMAKALLISTANTYDPNQVRAQGDMSPTHQWFLEPVKRDIQGWGLPDLMTMHDAAPDAFVTDEEHPLTTGDSVRFTYEPPVGATTIHVTLVWTDVPANPGANPTLVNNLDLSVDQGLFSYHGNFGLDLGELSLPGGLPDDVNNFENVFLTNLFGDPVEITVTGTAVNLDADPATGPVDQPFALVVMAY